LSALPQHRRRSRPPDEGQSGFSRRPQGLSDPYAGIRRGRAVAIALRSQFKGDKFWQFHVGMMSSRGLVDKTRALSVAKGLGADMNQLNKDLTVRDRHHLQKLRNSRRSQRRWTPTFVIGGSVISGEQNFDQLSASSPI